MMAPTGPMTITSGCRSEPETGSMCGNFRRKHGVIFIALVEIFGCLAIISVYSYALVMKPDWYPILVPIPNDLCNASDVVHGVMYIIVLLCALELLMAFYLLEGARRENLNRIRYWLSSMLTYLTLVTIVILGMDLGGIRCPSMNSAAFLNIFIRFLEFLGVYAWAEQESMQRRLRCTRGFSNRPCEQSQDRSSLTICTLASGLEGELGNETTPPPSYSDAIPSRPFQLPQQQNVIQISPPVVLEVPSSPVS